jgi:hypothetical protein
MRSLSTGIVKCKQACRLTLATSVILCLFSFPSHADERQYKIEAAFLYSFFNYITWPDYASPQELREPIICVYGIDPILPYLNYIRGKMAGERTLSVRVTDSDMTGCHILFVRHRLASSLQDALAGNTLLVFKLDDPLDRGGMIELSEDGDRMAMRINQSRLERSGFQVSSRLLDLARRVK